MPSRPTRRTVLRSATLLAAGTALDARGLFTGSDPAPEALLVPALQQWTPAPGSFLFGPSSRLVVDPAYGAELAGAAATTSGDLLALAGLRLAPVNDQAANLRTGDVFLTLGSTDAGLGDEGYLLILGTTARIEARTATGAFFATRTLLQMLRRSSAIPAGTARDWPRYRERGLLVGNEPLRFSMQWWREQIRELSFLKMNMLWLYVGYPLAPMSEMQAVAAMARRYHLTVVPQFNMPGHMESVLTGRPDLHLRDPDRPGSLDLSKDAAYVWAQDRLRSLLPGIESPFWHTGADEYMLFGDYRDYPELLAYARSHYGPQATELDTVYGFVRMVNQIVRGSGRTLRMWNDGIAPTVAVPIERNVVIEHWINHGRPAADLLADGYQVQNSNLDFTYGPQFDAAKIYNQFRVGQFHGSSVPDDHPGLLGAKLHIWVGSDGNERQISGDLFAPTRSLAQVLWGSPRPAYAEFTSRVQAVGHAPGNTIWLTDQTSPSGRAFVSADAVEQHVFAGGGSAGGVLHWWYNDATGSRHADRWTGGPVTGQSIGYPHGAEQHVFAQGQDGSLRHWSWSPGQMDNLPHLDDWGAGPGVMTSGPAGYAVGGQQHVFYRASNGTLQHRFYDRSWDAVGVENWGGDLVGRPVAFVHGDEQHVFARGSDGSLRHWWYYPGLPSVPARDVWAGPGSVTDDPTGYAIGDQQHVFYRDADGRLRHQYWDHSNGGIVTEDWGGEIPQT